MKQLKQILLLLVVLVVVALVVNYALSYFMPSGPYLEGFTGSNDVTISAGKNAIMHLYSFKNTSNLSDISLNNLAIEIGTKCTSNSSYMSKECFNAILDKLSLKANKLTTPDYIDPFMAKEVISVLNKQVRKTPGTLSVKDIEDVIDEDTTLKDICKVSATSKISKECYNALYDKFVTNADKNTINDDLSVDEDEDAVKDRRVELFMTLAETVGYDDVKEKNVRNSYDDMTKSCGKKSSSYDRACYEDIAADLKLTLFSGSKDTNDTKDTNTKSSTDTKSTTSSITDSLFSKSDVSGGTYNAKCTVEFGKDVVNPQTKAATTKAPDTTCTTTGDVAKTTKTPAVEQGCEFTQKFPKVNVINLRDYVHKDEVPCWSCKL